MTLNQFDSSWTLLGEYPIETEHHIVQVRQTIRSYAKQHRMGIVEQTRITTAVSELFRNMYNYADGGKVLIHEGDFEGHFALIVTCVDEGPGIDDLELALSDGYTSGMGMGYGLPGTRRLVDHFEIETEKGKGTIVRIMKWR